MKFPHWCLGIAAAGLLSLLVDVARRRRGGETQNARSTALLSVGFGLSALSYYFRLAKASEESVSWEAFFCGLAGTLALLGGWREQQRK